MTKIGVVVGRFQLPGLHWGHSHLLQQVAQRSDQVLVFIGTNQTGSTKNNPLDFEMRKKLVQDYAPKALVLPVQDQRSNRDWSFALDSKIVAITAPQRSDVTLYGGRDSFIKRYEGMFKTEEIGSPEGFTDSATAIRGRYTADIAWNTKTSLQFQQGVTWATQQQYDRALPTVDAIIQKNFVNPVVLLGRKLSEAQLRFPGGFVDPTDSSLEAAVRREVHEETRMSCDSATYLGSFQVDDWRFRGERDKILTSVFEVEAWGSARAGDDLSYVEWVPVARVKANPELVVPEHRPIVERFLETK